MTSTRDTSLEISATRPVDERDASRARRAVGAIAARHHPGRSEGALCTLCWWDCVPSGKPPRIARALAAWSDAIVELWKRHHRRRYVRSLEVGTWR